MMFSEGIEEKDHDIRMYNNYRDIQTGEGRKRKTFKTNK